MGSESAFTILGSLGTGLIMLLCFRKALRVSTLLLGVTFGLRYCSFLPVTVTAALGKCIFSALGVTSSSFG